MGERKKFGVLVLFALIFAMTLGGCAGNTNPLPGASPTTAVSAQAAIIAGLTGAHVSFYHGDYYSLTNPNPNTHCAGDAKNYYDPLLMSGTSPLLLQTSATDSSTTIRPAFIKNIAVDETDTNANISLNNAFSCSYGNGTNAPPVSSCATFDFGAINGIPSSLGGTVIFEGGLASPNYNGHSPTCGPIVNGSLPTSTSGFNKCNTSMYALGINVLSSSAAGTTLAPSVPTTYTGSISSWTNLATASTATAPLGISGGAAAYSPDLNSLIIFSGSTPQSGVNSFGSSTSTYDTWIYNLNSEAWAYQIANSVIDTNLQRLFDYNASFAETVQLSKPAGGRALFGYQAVSGMAIAQLSDGGKVIAAAGTNSNGVDITDRIITVGGLGSCAGGTCTDTHRFNPTFGPEYYDGLESTPAPSASPIATPSPLISVATYPVQYMDSYPVELMSNSAASSNYYPARSTPVNTANPPLPTSIAFGMIGLNNSAAAHGGIGKTAVSSYPNPQTSASAANISGTGYLVAAGGFQGTSTQPGNINYCCSTCDIQAECGGMTYMNRWSTSGTYTPGDELISPVFNAATNFLDLLGHEFFPTRWYQLYTTPASDPTPWYGGVSFVSGLRLSSINEGVYFGGSDCKYYLVGPYTTGCTDGLEVSKWPGGTTNPPLERNLGKYWNFTDSPIPTTIPSVTIMVGTVPINAGMAAAQGTDPNGSPLVVAWGGMTDTATPDGTGTIYYLYNNSGVPTWNSTTPLTGVSPPGVGNGAMVFSHVTRKFYLFGGYSPLQGSVATTYELTVNNASCGTTGACTFTWRLLSSTTGLSCYPACPPGRRSHKIVEANYAYLNFPAEPGGASCTATQPCSFGIFMEGGTSDGVSYFGDRWMFDPTANAGAGNWQEVGDFPPRTLASIGVADYTSINTGTVLHRAVMFGGETGMQDTLEAYGTTSTNYVPPTLGDTWIYDFDTSSWNRAILYGEKYPAASIPALPEGQARAADSTGSAPYVYSPPPTAGGIMVVRSISKPTHVAADAATALVIPEIFFFGGRKKDGTFNLLNDVYKFCNGSTGEKPYPVSPTYANTGFTTCAGANDATCDAYNVVTNPGSPSPTTAYLGKWLAKNVTTALDPPVTAYSIDPSEYGSFLGAGTYDSIHDNIVLYGGLAPTVNFTTAAVTDTTSTSVNYCGEVGTNSCILEYQPPSKVNYNNGGVLPTACGTSTLPTITTDQTQGIWQKVPACITASPSLPVGRTGHSISFDAFHQLLVVVGGYDGSGNPLLMPNGVSPQIWTAMRIDTALPDGNTALNIPPILSTSTFPCYYWSEITEIANTATAPLTGLANSASIYIPSSGYNSGYYTTTQNACTKAGPIASTDPTISSTLVGGAYFDIDRTQLQPNENLILNVTILPLGTANEHPDQTYLTSAETANFRIHLISTGQTAAIIRQQPQPRDLVYSSTTEFPQIVQELTLLSNPSGVVHQEQILIPLSSSSLIDRIRIERYSGNAILIDAALYRMNHN